MESRAFLDNELQKLANKFEGITLSSFYDEVYSQHVIVVSPSEKYLDENFAQQQVELELIFIEKFPFEALYFVEDGALDIPINASVYSNSNESIQIPVTDVICNIPSFINLFNINVPIYIANSEVLLSKVEHIYVNEDTLSLVSKTMDVKINVQGEENSYAMAA
ncbi:MAG: hypothetical protein IPG89_12550 [Bacteroidetes bacterium]|nr:hypothetical protein [Bacteroidota bacterium]